MTLASRSAALVCLPALLVACRRAPPLITSPTRSVELRVSYAPLDRWRPLDARAREPVALAAFDALARRDEWNGVAALALIAGTPTRAADALARAPEGPDRDAEAAALSLARGDVARALEELDGLLHARPRHGPSRWNRALALVALDLPLAAADEWDAVAALGEPGWSDEAKRRAAALRRGWDERVARANQAFAAGEAMVAGKALPDDALVARYPSLMRHYLYHAVRAAPSTARLDELRPLARTLDAVAGDDTLTHWLDRVAKEAPAARARFGPRYAGYVLMPGSPPAAEQDRFLAELARAGADDVRLGSLVLFGRSAPRDLDDLRALVARNGDPWWQATLDGIEADGLAARGRLDDAARRLAGALAHCRSPALDYRRAALGKQLALVEQERHHTGEARRQALAAVASAQRVGLDPHHLETSTLFLLSEIARYRNDFALMRAYLAEGVRRVPDLCDVQRHAHLVLGIEHVFELDFDAAARELAATPRCDPSFALLAADLTTSVVRAGRRTPAAATLAADLAAVRPSLTPGQQLIAEVEGARLFIDGDRAAGRAGLARALAEPRRVADTDAKKARTMAYQTVAVDDARAGDFGAAVTTLAAEAGATAAPRCALAVAVDDARTLVAARGSDGRALGVYDPARARADVDAAELVPPSVRAALAGCAEVSVFALAPLHGQPALLPPELAWSYRMGRQPRAAPSLAARRVVVSDVTPPASLALPRLLPWRSDTTSTWLTGADATPRRVLAELGDATEIEINAHGLIDLDLSDTWLVALSPDVDGTFALTANDIEQQHLGGQPLVVLGACYAGRVAPYLHEPWSLPMAFLDAGARAVFASAAAIPDASAGAFFDAVLARVHRGQSPATALRDERLARLRDDPGNWVRQVLLFE